jgi:predicted  nucleic acid-binding Zn-ribbon protein
MSEVEFYRNKLRKMKEHAHDKAGVQRTGKQITVEEVESLKASLLKEWKGERENLEALHSQGMALKDTEIEALKGEVQDGEKALSNLRQELAEARRAEAKPRIVIKETPYYIHEGYSGRRVLLFCGITALLTGVLIHFNVPSLILRFLEMI